MELQKLYADFEALGVSAVAVSQEDKDLASAQRFLRGWDPPPPFPIVADFERRVTTAYDRTTAYLIDADGVVRQVFPMLIHMRATGRALVREAQALLAR